MERLAMTHKKPDFSDIQFDREALQKQKTLWMESVKQSDVRCIFAYGSLMWKPDCTVKKTMPVTLTGYHRSFNIYSYIYRGTPENLGLVLGLSTGGICQGLAMRLTEANLETSLSCLWDREMINGSYVPEILYTTTDSGEEIPCYGFLANTTHPQWAGNLSIAEKAVLIQKAYGHFGSNYAYLKNTVDSLRKMDIDDDYLEELLAAVDSIENNTA